jgi:uncharacterized repeat protein (TIGR03803 family)
MIRTKVDALSASARHTGTQLNQRIGRGKDMSRLSGWKTACFLFLLCVGTAISSSAQTYTVLADFINSMSPYVPLAPLVQGFDGNFYGTTDAGPPPNANGTIFQLTPGGTLTTLYGFNGTDGQFPSGLVLATNGNFYGTTSHGGLKGAGIIFEITPGGTLTTLHNFCSRTSCADGEFPGAGLVQVANGTFYGTTEGGGAHFDGTVFAMSARGTVTTLHSFDGTDGQAPLTALVLDTNGLFYGTTGEGGAIGSGTIFDITAGGTLTTLHSFLGGKSDGSTPEAALVQATTGVLYGTAFQGGIGCANGCGTVFSITPGGRTMKTLHRFVGKDGSGPVGLLQATDGNLYGITLQGGTGADNGGTIFELTPAGTFTTLYNFCSQSSSCSDGGAPLGLVQGTDGSFYGTTSFGGLSTGTAFNFSVGLAPFVASVPTSGKGGTVVVILGNKLTGATNVTFNGAAATFTVVSATEITTTVPAGATTGTIMVTTPSGTLSSNVAFRIL